METSTDVTTRARRLDAVRAEMARQGLDYLVVRSTDAYLNEYVPHAESTREWLTGFTGSLGDALVGRSEAWLFVDGRYHVQADREVDLARWSVVKNALGVSNEKATGDKLIELAKDVAEDLVVGFEPDRYAVSTMEAFEKQLLGHAVSLRAASPSPVEAARGVVAPTVVGSGAVRALDEAAVGKTVAEKVADVAKWLAPRRCDALWATKLDEIAWLANLRGEEMSFQATFRAEALVTRDALYVHLHVAAADDALRAARPGVRFVTREALLEVVRSFAADGRRGRVALDPASVPVARRAELEALGVKVLPVASPVVAAKAKKNPAELAAMKSALGRADRVVADAQRWLQAAVGEGRRVSEVDFAREVERLFLAAGAVGLSFKVISAFGLNGAVVHHPPSESTFIEPGQLMLLDTGCYFVEGYATDLTRTFFVGAPGAEPTAAQRRLFTLVLKSAIAGMTARMPKNAVGAQLDGITRAPLWREGVDYAHGTGHGVGINVHEAPPSVSKLSTGGFEEGQVFSIEPGLYLEGTGGVRIENLCTVAPDPDQKDWIRVEPLTFSPLDSRLIDDALLDDTERAFVARYAAAWETQLHAEGA
ncbi:MAG: M24 family metallopeptidase [Polyangiales bacterium]